MDQPGAIRLMEVVLQTPSPARSEEGLQVHLPSGVRVVISGPLLDRIDLHGDMPLVDYKALASTGAEESSGAIRQRVESVRASQAERFKGQKSTHTNSGMTPRLIKTHC